MNINIFRGDLTDISAKKEALAQTRQAAANALQRAHTRPVSAKTLVTSPQELFISIIRNNIYRVNLSNKCLI